MELIILIALALFAFSYRKSADASASGAFKFIQNVFLDKDTFILEIIKSMMVILKLT